MMAAVRGRAICMAYYFCLRMRHLAMAYSASHIKKPSGCNTVPVLTPCQRCSVSTQGLCWSISLADPLRFFRSICPNFLTIPINVVFFASLKITALQRKLIDNEQYQDNILRVHVSKQLHFCVRSRYQQPLRRSHSPKTCRFMRRSQRICHSSF